MLELAIDLMIKMMIEPLTDLVTNAPILSILSVLTMPSLPATVPSAMFNASSIADWLILAVILLSTVQAARRGIFLEAFSLAGILLGIALGSWNYTRYAPWFQKWCHSAPLADAAAFLAIALLVMIVAGLIGRLIRWSMRTIGLGWADRLLGAIFGLCKGAVLVTLGVMLLVAFWPASPALHGSRLAPYFVEAARACTIGTPSELADKVRFGAQVLREHAPVVPFVVIR